MDTFKKVIKNVLTGALTVWMITVFFWNAPVKTMANEGSSSTTSSSSTNSGQNLYDALRAIYGDTSSSSSSKSSSSSALTVEQLMKRIETEPVGPKVQDTSLSESYHEDYMVYEEELGGVYTIYSNIGNGTVTNRPVVIDVPRGVGVSMKKDGVAVPFVTKQKIEGKGSYVLELFAGADEDSMAAFSEQTFLKAKFRFRIQSSSGVDGVVGEGDFEDEEELSPSESLSEFADLMEDTVGTQEVSENDALSAPETEGEDAADGGNTDISAPENTDILSVWDNSSGYYQNVLKTGETFFTSLPNGSITNEPVTVQTTEGLEFTAYKDGKEYTDFVPGEPVNVVGSYAVYISKPGDEAFLDSYPFGNPAFRFRIINRMVSDIGMINAPYGVTIRNVRYNGLDANDTMLINSYEAHIDSNGDYEITFDDEAGSREVTFTLDNEPPVFAVDVQPNEAKVTYYSGDIARCVLYRGDKIESEQPLIDSVTRSGKYTLIVYDAAGNSSKSEFTVRYRINAAAVIAIFAVLAVIAAAVVYIYRMRKNVKVV